MRCDSAAGQDLLLKQNPQKHLISMNFVQLFKRGFLIYGRCSSTKMSKVDI